MIAKTKLLDLVDEALRTEERMIGIYCTHCAIAVDMSAAPSEKLESFRETVMRLRDESRGHRNTLEELRAALLREDRDEF